MPPIDGPWAKLARDETGAITAALPLADHSFDVAAAMAALLAGGAWARALERTAGRALTKQDHARLTALAALHDIGKANSGFQARAVKPWPPVGHEGQVEALIADKDLGASVAGGALRAMTSEWGAFQHLAALMAHHGRPRIEFSRSNMARVEPWDAHRQHWWVKDGYDPTAEAAKLIDKVRARWPLAWAIGAKLPDHPRFVALFAGLVTLADWLGSDTRLFPVERPHGAARDAMRDREATEAIAARGLLPLATPPAEFTGAFDVPEPRGVQRVADAGDLGPVALIEAETGSGKTETALWRWLQLRRAGHVDGLYFALPTRTAAVQLHARVDAMLKRVWGDDAPEAMLAVPGYLQAGEAKGRALPGYEVRWDLDESGGGSDSRWAAERANRYLAARVAVGTIDQALLAALQVKHSLVRAATLARSLLVVDEVHASDAYMGTLLKCLLDNHVPAGGHALLLSATLGSEARHRLIGGELPSLEDASAQPYPALAGSHAPVRQAPSDGTRAKQVTIEIAKLIDDAEAIAARAIVAARDGASVLVVRNSVAGALAVAKAVEARAAEFAFRVNDVSTLHHGRFAPSDRRLLDTAVEQAFGKKRTAQGRVLVGTQTLEQSLDIDADLLLTDLAPMDVLLQRIGRLHRHPHHDRGRFGEARAVILCPAERDLTRLLGRVRDRHGLGPMKQGAGVYPDLLQLEATLRMLEDHPAITIPADNRRLVEGALHPQRRDALTTELGTAWANHDATLMGIAHAERQQALAHALDLSNEFRKLAFPDAPISTRLGARDYLIDFDPPLPGPFGPDVRRLSIPYWFAGSLDPRAKPFVIGADADGQRFDLGDRGYLYGRWGLSPLAPAD